MMLFCDYSYAQSQSDKQVANIIRTWYKILGQKSVNANGLISKERYHIGSIGEWEVQFFIDNNKIVQSILFGAIDTHLSRVPGDVYIRSLEIIQNVFPGMFCRKEVVNNDGYIGGYLAPNSIQPDYYSGGNGIVNTIKGQTIAINNYCSINETNSEIVVSGYGGADTTIAKNGMVVIAGYSGTIIELRIKK